MPIRNRVSKPKGLCAEGYSPDHHSASRSSTFVRHDVKLSIDIHWARGGKLGDLRETTLLENVTHCHEGLLEGQIRRSIVVIFVEDLQHGARTGTTGTTRRVGQLEVRNV